MSDLSPPLSALAAAGDHVAAATWMRGLAAALAWAEELYCVVAVPPDSSTRRLATLCTDSLTLAVVRTPYDRLELHVRDAAAMTGRDHVYAEAWLRSPHALAEHLSQRFPAPARRAPIHTVA